MAAVTHGFALLLCVFLVVVLWTSAQRPAVRSDGPARDRSLGYRIDLNTADAPTLELLPGIGPSIAKNIVKARLAGGVFAGPDDLEAVKYVGPKLIQRVGPFVEYGAPPESAAEQLVIHARAKKAN